MPRPLQVEGVAVWCSDNASISINALSPVSTGIGDCLQAGKLSHYVTSHLGQLSVAIPPWVGAGPILRRGGKEANCLHMEVGWGNFLHSGGILLRLY